MLKIMLCYAIFRQGWGQSNLGATVVKKLVEPPQNSGRNITCDRYFTGVEMTETLKSNNLTVVRTVMPNKKYLPVELTKKQVVFV